MSPIALRCSRPPRRSRRQSARLATLAQDEQRAEAALQTAEAAQEKKQRLQQDQAQQDTAIVKLDALLAEERRQYQLLKRFIDLRQERPELAAAQEKSCRAARGG